MRDSWKTKVKKLGALVLALVIFVNAMPYTYMGKSKAEETEAAFRCKVQITDENGSTEDCTDAAVTVTLQSDTSKSATAAYDDTTQQYTAALTGWTVTANDVYSIHVVPSQANASTYEEYNGTYTVTENDATSKHITMENPIVLQKKAATEKVTYTVSVKTDSTGTGTGMVYVDGQEAEDTNVEENTASPSYKFVPGEGSQIESIIVKSIDEEGTAVTPTTENPIDANGAFTYAISNVTKNTEIIVKFAQIPTVDITTETSVKFTDDAGNDLQKDIESNKYYLGTDNFKAALNTTDGTTAGLSTEENGTYGDSVSINTNTGYVYFWENKNSFGGKKKLTINSDLFVVDNTAPTITVEQSSVWTGNDTITIVGTAADDSLHRVVWSKTELSAPQNATENITTDIGENGGFSINHTITQGSTEETVYLYAIDKSGNYSTAATVMVRKDTEAPTATINVVGTTHTVEDTTYFFGDISFEITGVADALSGFKGITTYLNGTEVTPSSANGVYTVSTAGKELNAGGAYELKVVLEDNVGNSTGDTLIKPVYRDADAPTAAITVQETPAYSSGGKDYYNSDVTFQISNVVDTGSGVKSVTAYINGTEVETSLANGVYTVSTAGKAPNAQGAYELKVRLEDNVGNVAESTSELTKTVYKDIKAPTAVIEAAPIHETNGTLYCKDDVTFTIKNVTDDVSGFASIEIYINDEEIAEDGYTLTGGVYTVSTAGKELNAAGAYELKVVLADNVGNSTGDTLTKTVKRDADAPTADISIPRQISTIDGKKYYAEDITFTISNIADTLSGIKSVVINGTTMTYPTANNTYTVSTEDMAIGADGKYQLEVVITDNVGNIKEVTETVYKDTTKPTATITAAAPVYTDAKTKKAYYGDDVTFTISDIADEISGIYSVEINGTKMDYPVENNTYTVSTKDMTMGTDGEYKLTVVVKDNVGRTQSYTKTVYVDKTNPEITKFDVSKKEDLKDKVLRMLTFGGYSNTKVEVKVTAADKNVSAGLNAITLRVGEKTYTATKLDGNTATFELPASAITENKEKVYLNTGIEAVVVDNVIHTSGYCKMTAENSNMKHENLMIETVNPTVKISLEKSKKLKGKDIPYHNGTPVFQVEVSDADSGIYSVKVEINGTEKVNTTYKTQQTKQETYRVSTAGVTATDQRLYTLEIKVVDNAGNVVASSSQVYKDVTVPRITKFEMTAGNVSEENVKASSVTETTYGYYFSEDTTVTVYATDGTKDGDSGVKKISYYTVDIDGKESTVKTKNVDDEGKISFVVPAEFKGQIYACAYDKLGNHAKNSSSSAKYVTPKGVVIETKEQHTKENHIAYQKEKTDHKDNNGRALYEDSIDVVVTVTDTFSGIQKVEWNVTAPYDTEKNQSGQIEINAFGNFTAESDKEGWRRTEKENNLVTELQKTLTISNNSNEIVVRVKMTDNAGNESSKKMIFSIDRTKPEIQIQFDNETPDAEYNDMYKENRVATITVAERNFNADDMETTITNSDGVIPQISGWQTVANTENPDNTISTAAIVFEADGDYTLAVNGKDRADNVAMTAAASDFTIDKTVPVISVSYDNNNAINGNYYAESRTATIQIEEHNFSPERVQITGTATDDEAAISFPEIGGWSQNGDIYTASIVCGTDGLYRFDIAYNDKAGNEAVNYVGEEYYVDMTEPEIEITGVADMSANNGDVQPVITLSDTNYDINGVTLQLTGANRGTVELEGNYSAQGNGQVFTFENFPMEQSYDDIYTLTAKLVDKAGNEFDQDITFSVNRFGSVYVFDDSLKEIAGTYVTEERDVKLKEVNVDSLNHDKIRVVLDVNGTPKDLVEGTDYSVVESGGEGNWYQYDYTINKQLFTGDGRYIVSVYSEDAAGNINENNAESKEAEITFGIDKTAPVIVPINITAGESYNTDVLNATVSIKDNLVLENVEIFVGEQKCEYNVEGENYTFAVASAAEPQDITINAYDLAGNITPLEIGRVLVTTSWFIRWMNNKALFYGSIIGGVLVVSGTVGGVFAIRRKKGKVQK